MRPEIEGRRINLAVNGFTLEFFCYNDRDDNEARVSETLPYFVRLPVEHLRAVCPVLLIRDHPTRAAGTGGGGTMASQAGGFRGLPRPHGAEASGVPAEDTGEILENAGVRGRNRGLQALHPR